MTVDAQQCYIGKKKTLMKCIESLSRAHRKSHKHQTRGLVSDRKYEIRQLSMDPIENLVNSKHDAMNEREG